MDLTMILTFVAAILVLIGFIYSIFHLFEKSKPSVEYIVLLAILIAIAVVGRLIGMSLPSIQLASFIIIVVGIVYGGETGFLVGMFTAVVSDLFMGIGYWTFFQMLAWGLMGYSAGLFSSKLENIGIRVVFGFLWGYLYGWITDFCMIPYMSSVDLNGFIALYAAGIPVDTIHGLVNAVLLAVAFTWIRKIFLRNKVKYLPDKETAVEEN
ncbi:MAG: ECF transporter S component [archaeon]|nr:ECF transporter S component [archaeon]